MPATATATACVSELLLQMGSIVSGVDSSGGVGDDHGIIVGQRKRGRSGGDDHGIIVGQRKRGRSGGDDHGIIVGQRKRGRVIEIKRSGRCTLWATFFEKSKKLKTDISQNMCVLYTEMTPNLY